MRCRVLAVLTIILMATVYGLPSSLHFKFCVGDDGHWDITAVACVSDQQAPVSKHSNPNPNDHHENCNDFSTACDVDELCALDSLFFHRNPYSKVFQLAPVSNTSCVILQPATKPSVSPVCSSEISFSLPAYLSSVILLV